MNSTVCRAGRLSATAGSAPSSVMTDQGKPASAPPRADDRAARLAAALRENLKRRKAQARARDSDAGRPPPPSKVAGEKPMG